jgi:hypothetical protein
MPMGPALSWAAAQVGVGARVVSAERLRAGAGPWRLRIDRGGKAIEAVLRVGDTRSRQQLATEAAALAFAEDHRLVARGCSPSTLTGTQLGGPPC